MASRALVLGIVAVALGAACGGKVTFVEGSGSGSGGDASTGSASTTKSATASTGTGASTCDDLLAAFQAAAAEAQVCDPTIDLLQCDGTIILLDACDCPSLVLNETNPDAVKKAFAARDAWTGAGCPTLECAACFQAMGGSCSPAPGPNGKGVCVGLSLNGG